MARLAQEQGAEVVLTGFGRMQPHRAHRQRLPTPAPVIELDVTNDDDLAALADRVREHVDGVDGVLHSIGFAPAAAMGGNFLNTAWEDVATARARVRVLAQVAHDGLLCRSCRTGGAVVGPHLRRHRRLAEYDWMGVAKAAFESTARYLARDLGPQGIRVNLVAAGPDQDDGRASRSRASTQFDECGPPEPRSAGTLPTRTPTAQACVALLSDWFPKTTGEIVHVDGGVHAIGA